jgi:hypothetical protein
MGKDYKRQEGGRKRKKCENGEGERNGQIRRMGNEDIRTG